MSAEASPVATVVIPVRNGGDLLPDELDALLGQVDAPPFEVVIADNGSTDDTIAVALGYTDRLNLRVVDAGQHPGVSHARNIGAAAAQTGIVMFCDADDQVCPEWVGAMVRGLADADIVGGPLNAERLSDEAALRRRYVPPATELATTMKFLPYASGGNLAVRSDLFEELGGFDTEYQGGHEEVDFAWRAQLAGYTVGFAPEAVIHYRLRDNVRAAMKQTYRYGRTYTQLFSRFRDQPIPRTPWRREIRTYGILLARGARMARKGEPMDAWLCTMSWTAGRLVGDVRYRVRAPL